MFKAKAILQGRKRAREDRKWIDGYNWADGALLRGEESQETIEEKTMHDTSHPFDQGARAASYKYGMVTNKQEQQQ